MSSRTGLGRVCDDPPGYATSLCFMACRSLVWPCLVDIRWKTPSN